MNWKYRGMLAWILILVLTAGFLVTGSAEMTGNATGGVSVNLGNHPNIKEYLAKDSGNKVVMSLYKVASSDGGDGWNVDSRYASFGIVEAEAKLRTIAADNDSGIQKILEDPDFQEAAMGTKPIAKAEMDANGNVSFSNLELGIYYGIMTQGPEGLLVQFLAPLPFRYLGLELNNVAVNAKIDEKITITVSGSKTWDDKNNEDGLRPESIIIRLKDGEKEIKRKTVTAADGWKWSFTGLDKLNEKGEEIKYTITEDRVPNYTSVVKGYDVTNSHTPTTPNTPTTPTTPTVPGGNTPVEPNTISVSGGKDWVDNYDADGMRPNSITIRLLANGTEVARKTVSEADGWSWAFTGLDRYDESNEEIVYSITEDAVPNYTAKVTGFNVTNTYTPTVTVAGRKTWSDDNNADGKRPASITIRLLADGTEVERKTVTAADNWRWSFDNLDKLDQFGNEITYRITEDEVPNYSARVSGYNVTNTYVPEPITVAGSKTWNDDNNADGMRPASITIHLFANDTEVRSATVTAANGWSWSFENLEKLDQNGREITYSITEDAVPFYTSQVNGYNVTNTYQREETSATVRKVWDDNNNEFSRRPAKITAVLSNGTQVILSEANGWSATVDHLPVYKNGEKVEYTWTEHEVLGYTLTNSTTVNGVTTLTNSLWQRPEPPEGKTVPPVPGTPTEEFEDYNTPLGIEVIINHVGDCFD